MSRLAWCVCLGASIVATSAGAAPKKPAPSDEVHFLYLSDNAVLLLELHVRVDGRSFRENWKEFTDTLFDKVDADGNGVLEAREARKIPQPNDLKQLGIPAKSRGISLKSPTGIDEFIDDDPADGKISREEFRDYLKNVGALPFSIRAAGSSNARRGSYGAEKRRLFERIDLDGNGTLSQKELRRAPRALRKLDLDDDETISLAELAPNPLRRFTATRSRNSAEEPPKEFMIFHPGTIQTTLVLDLLHQFDVETPQDDGAEALPPDRQLSRDEFRLPRSVFDKFDGDESGRLDFDELHHLLRRPSGGIELTVRLARSPGQRPPGKTTEVKATANDGGPTTNVGTDGYANIVHDKVQLDVGAESGAAWRQNPEDTYTRIFKSTDANNNGYLEPEEARRVSLFSENFDTMDADGDGKLFEEEMLAYVKDMIAASQARIEVQIVDQGRNLFDVLDMNRDQRISPRELRSSLARVDLWDENGDREVSVEEIPRRLRATVALGKPANLSGPVVVASPGADAVPRSTPQAAPNAPLWFRKMDVNSDGEVSQREFLGSLKDFRKLDTDKNGAIGVAESRTADK